MTQEKRGKLLRLDSRNSRNSELTLLMKRGFPPIHVLVLVPPGIKVREGESLCEPKPKKAHPKGEVEYNVTRCFWSSSPERKGYRLRHPP